MSVPDLLNPMTAQRCHIFPYAPSYGYYEPLTQINFMPTEQCNGGSEYGSTHAVYTLQTSSHLSSQSVCYHDTPSMANPLAPWGQTPHNPKHYSGYTVDETRKVVVTSIQRKSCPHEVSHWIRHQVGEYAAAITDLDIPVDGSKGNICGHAVITLANTTAAESTMRILDQKLFQGRVVSARLAIRDGSDAQRSKASKDAGSSRQHRQEPESKHKRAEQTRPTRKSDAKSRDSKHVDSHSTAPKPSTNLCCAATETQEKSAHASRPVIAHGSSARSGEKKK